MALQSSRIQGNLYRTCVIDPVLALSEYGIPLIQHLGKAMELWVVRELWNILDNPTLYLNQPELITPRGLTHERPPEQERRALESTLRSLRAWETFRLETDLAGLHLFWLGDSPKESLLPRSRTLELFYRWETIAKSLDRQLKPLHTRDNLLHLAFQDTIALAVSLGSAFILSYQSPTDFEQNLPPELCRDMECWGMTCQALPSEDAMVVEERHALRQLLISTDTAKYLWAGTHLIVLHLIIPTNFGSHKQPLQSSELPSGVEESTNVPKLISETWKNTRGFWYFL
jgi:hypothetical protein